VSEQIVEQPQADAAPPPEPVAQESAPAPEPVAQEPAEPADPEAEFDAAVAAQAIDVPDGDRLVPLSAVTRLREKLREAKTGSNEAATLREQLQQVETRLRETEPLAQAFRAIQQATPQQQQVQQHPSAAPVEDTTELVEIAKDFDFYKPNGEPDLDRARRHQDRVLKTAEKVAEARTAPLVQHTLTGQAQHNIARLKVTKHPQTGLAPDPKVVDALVAQIANQPGGLATLASQESMKHLWANAYTYSTLQPGFGAAPAQAAAPAAPVTPPLVTERSGGAVAAQPKGLSASEKKAAKEAGLTEREYLDVAKGMKW
jgi:hypothetical protein